MDIVEMKTKTISDLLKVAKDLDIQGVGGLKKQELHVCGRTMSENNMSQQISESSGK
jgi:hypothetical protein